MNVEVLRDLIKKCDIYFEDQLISGELLLRVFTDFLSEEADRQEKQRQHHSSYGIPVF